MLYPRYPRHLVIAPTPPLINCHFHQVFQLVHPYPDLYLHRPLYHFLNPPEPNLIVYFRSLNYAELRFPFGSLLIL